MMAYAIDHHMILIYRARRPRARGASINMFFKNVHDGARARPRGAG
eukprot:SAG31_NODE_152_length_22216_cov_16.550029_16_plen_45_part_01